MDSHFFGETEEGEPVLRVVLAGGGLTAFVMNWGATLQDLRLVGHNAPLTLGFDRFADYLHHSPYFGATPGRCANRIAFGRFTLDGKEYQLDRNQTGEHHLHGGRAGLGKRLWQIADHGADYVRFEIDDPDGHMGYPGNCRISCTYHLKPGGILSVIHEAETDQPTLCNMAHHSYFNLDGRADILDHELMIAAENYLPVDESLIPTGEVKPVADTPFNFQQSRPVRWAEGDGQIVYDHNFCLSGSRVGKRTVARLRSPHSGVSMDVRTSESGLQFYSGHKINPAVPGLIGKNYGAHSGLCLEAQVWPDAANHDLFPTAELRPGEPLLQQTDYVFSIG